MACPRAPCESASGWSGGCVHFRRHHGLCAVPGCSRQARHVHHITFRSRGGPDETWNKVAICIPHHLHGIHRGFLVVSGRAGERLFWKLGTREVWVTEGDENVRRAS